MNSSAATILARAQHALLDLDAVSEDLARAADDTGKIDPEKALSNARVALEAVVALYANDDKASHFPAGGDAELLQPGLGSSRIR